MPVIRLLTTLASIALLAPAAASALTPQQERMKSCSTEASDKNLKGDERQSYMSRCLKGESKTPELTAQQEKMKTCNRQASEKGLKGDKRADFMSECLRADKSDRNRAATGGTRSAR